MGLPLPEDVVADVLRRLPPRSLAASRCVCKAWRAVVDARRLLRADLLPHSQSVRGIFVNCNDLENPVLLARPHPDPALHFDLPGFFSPSAGDGDEAEPEPGWWQSSYASILDHCNGLLIYADSRGLYVANLAMRRRARLPPPPPRFADANLSSLAHLVFDPAESPHYEVLIVPDSRGEEQPHQGMAAAIVDDKPSKSNQREWPPPTWVLCLLIAHGSVGGQGICSGRRGCHGFRRGRRAPDDIRSLSAGRAGLQRLLPESILCAVPWWL